MRAYGFLLVDQLADVVDKLKMKTSRSITEVFAWAIENLAVQEGIVGNVVELYMRPLPESEDSSSDSENNQRTEKERTE